MSRDRDVVEKVIASLKNIGHFEITPLREDGSGACYKATDTGRRISVSIRTLWPEASTLQKLLAQARSAQTLEHGNVAKVIGSGELDGAFFTVSSFVDGHTLRQNLNSGDHLNVWDLIDFARQACTGLEFAHTRGIVHHALHPDNVVLEFDGTTKMVDIALYRANARGIDPFHRNAAYLAPEQLAGNGADRMTNFYNIAVMLYEIATKQLPFQGDSWEALAFCTQNELVEPIKLNPTLPPGINAAIVKALSRDRSARYQSGPELVRALEDYKAFGKATPTKMVAPRPTAKVVPIDGANAIAPLRNPYAATDVLPSAEPRINLEFEHRSRIAPEKPELLGLQEAPAWRPSVAPTAPPAESTILPLPEPEVQGPSRTQLAKEATARLAGRTWDSIRRGTKRVDPWKAALGFMVVVLAFFVGRTVTLSFWGTPKKVEYVQLAPEPAATLPEGSVAIAPQTQPSIEPSPAPEPTPKNTGSHRTAPSVAPAMMAAPPPAPTTYVAAATGSVTITTTPPGARVLVDGRANPSYTSPQTIRSLAPGVHTLTISKDGYSPATRPVQISAGAQSHLDVQLELPAGYLTVLSTPSTAYILIDGVSTGHVTPSQVPVPAGTHIVTLRRLGYLEASDTFTIKSGEQQSRNVTLLEAGSTPEIRVAQTSGVRKMLGGNKIPGVRLNVRTAPAGATVVINGQSVARTTPVEFGLNPGNYVMELQLTGYQTIRKSIKVEDGKPLAFDESFHP